MSARRKPVRLPLDFDPGYARLRVLEHFSEEQRLQIRRLERVLAAEGKPSDAGEVIATLAAAALWVLGLDPLSRNSFERISNVVIGKGADADYFNALNDQWHAADDWTMAQRAAELGEPSAT